MTDAGASDADACGDMGATDVDAIEDLTDLFREYGTIDSRRDSVRPTDFQCSRRAGRPRGTRRRSRSKSGGAVEDTLAYSLSAFRDLPSVTQRQDFHCVTGWSKFDCAFTGVEVEEIIDRASVHDDADHVLFHALDGYTTNLSLEECARKGVLFAYGFDGDDLPADHGGPIRVVTPHQYAYKGPNGSRASSSSRRRNSATGRSAATATPRTRGTKSATANPPSAHPTALLPVPAIVNIKVPRS